jgi:hypothetical protein
VEEGEPDQVLGVLSAAPGVLEAVKAQKERDRVYEYLITGEKDRDIRRDVSLALSGGGLILLGTKQNDLSFEHVFLELIHADKEAPGDSGIETGI